MKVIYLIFWFIFLSSVAYSQVVYEPLWNDVYDYLDRLSQKGIIELDDLVKPLPRKYIYEKLLEAEKEMAQLTSLEKDELDYYKKEYFFESKLTGDTTQFKNSPNFFGKDETGRLRLFSYSNQTFKINVSPIIGYQLTLPGKERNQNTWNGLYGYGYLFDFLGYSMDLRVHNEQGSYLDPYKYFTPDEGIIASARTALETHENSFDYSEVKATISFSYKWGDLVFAKEPITYGYARSGNLVLSDKAPSFPFIRLDLHPIDWLSFHYFHAWLTSYALDSVNFDLGLRTIYRNKYFAWHSIVVTPIKGLDLSIGESIVYADQVEPVYLMPFMFFFLADDFLSNRTYTEKWGCEFSDLFFRQFKRSYKKYSFIWNFLY